MNDVVQGQFFLPRPWLQVPPQDVLEFEPLRRGDVTPQVCRYLYRDGARVFVKGSIALADHETIRLPFWHQVIANA